MTYTRKRVFILAVAVLVLSMLAAILLCPATNAYAEVVSAEDSSVGAAEEATEELVTECDASYVGEQPTRGGYNFEGWFSDRACTQEITDVAEAESSTVYAKWAEKSLAETYNAATSTYEVYTYYQLNSIRNYTSFDPIYNESVINMNIKLCNDITFADYLVWTPLPVLCGTFDGNGHKLIDFTMNVSETGNYGFFRRVERTGVIQNLTFVNANIKLSSDDSSSCIGLCAAICKGTINNCHVETGKIYTASYLSNAGTFVGICDGGTIKNCIAHNGMVVDGYGNLGGIVGSAITGATVEYCENYATILYGHKTQSKGAAGIVGRLVSGTIKYCDNYGAIKYDASLNASTSVRPCMAQIVGWKISGTLEDNKCNGECSYRHLYPNQKQYCSEGAVGREGE